MSPPRSRSGVSSTSKMNSGRVVPQTSHPPGEDLPACRFSSAAKYWRVSSGVPKKTSFPPRSSTIALWNIWKIREVGWWIVTSTILLCDMSRMISMMCSESFELRPLVGSSKRKMSAELTISRPIFSRLRSPPLRIFFSAEPTMEVRRSLRPSSASLLSMRRRRSRRPRCGARMAAAYSRFSSMVRCSSNASYCGI